MNKLNVEVADLADIDLSDSLEYPVLKPGNGQPTGWVITLAGPYHDKAVAWSNATSQRSLSKQAKLEAQRLNNRKIKVDDRTTDEQKAETVSWLASRILDWSPFKVPYLNNGEAIAFSDEAVKIVFSHVRMGWALQQIIDVLADESSFTTRSATT